jgi:hypothetical protein
MNIFILIIHLGLKIELSWNFIMALFTPREVPGLLGHTGSISFEQFRSSRSGPAMGLSSRRRMGHTYNKRAMFAAVKTPRVSSHGRAKARPTTAD